MAQKALWNIAKKRMLGDRGAFLGREEGGFVREYKAMHKENFPSIWMREDKEGKAKRSREEEAKSGKGMLRRKWKGFRWL